MKRDDVLLIAAAIICAGTGCDEREAVNAARTLEGRLAHALYPGRPIVGVKSSRKAEARQSSRRKK
ncbi:MAG: hypothetical protein ACRD3Q_21430 [Terriglobales bacterium]